MSLTTLYVDHGPTFIPFRLKREAAFHSHCTILGEAPKGVRPSLLEKETRYFATLALEDDLDVSIFTTFDYESEKSPFNFFAGTYKLHDQSSSLVQFLVHRRAGERDADPPRQYESTALGFVFGMPSTDPECSTIEALGNPAIFADHKVGGQPYFSQLEGDVGTTLTLLRDGYVHLLQLNMPSAREDTLIEGMWPFGESSFHIFTKKLGGVFEFRYIWG